MRCAADPPPSQPSRARDPAGSPYGRDRDDRRGDRRRFPALYPDRRGRPAHPARPARVKVHGREDLLGVVALPPNSLLPPGSGDRPAGMDRLWIDTGLEPGQVNQLVQEVTWSPSTSRLLELSGDALAGHSLDNRASVAALTACLAGLGSRRHAWDVWAVATVQEEVSFGGASTLGFRAPPGYCCRGRRDLWERTRRFGLQYLRPEQGDRLWVGVRTSIPRFLRPSRPWPKSSRSRTRSKSCRAIRARTLTLCRWSPRGSLRW